jgi:hypothetical protein
MVSLQTSEVVPMDEQKWSEIESTGERVWIRGLDRGDQSCRGHTEHIQGQSRNTQVQRNSEKSSYTNIPDNGSLEMLKLLENMAIEMKQNQTIVSQQLEVNYRSQEQSQVAIQSKIEEGYSALLKSHEDLKQCQHELQRELGQKFHQLNVKIHDQANTMARELERIELEVVPQQVAELRAEMLKNEQKTMNGVGKLKAEVERLRNPSRSNEATKPGPFSKVERCDRKFKRADNHLVAFIPSDTDSEEEQDKVSKDHKSKRKNKQQKKNPKNKSAPVPVISMQSVVIAAAGMKTAAVVVGTVPTTDRSTLTG